MLLRGLFGPLQGLEKAFKKASKETFNDFIWIFVRQLGRKLFKNILNISSQPARSLLLIIMFSNQLGNAFNSFTGVKINKGIAIIIIVFFFDILSLLFYMLNVFVVVVYTDENGNKTLVLLCGRSKKLKNHYWFYCFRSTLLKKHWCYSVFAQKY